MASESHLKTKLVKECRFMGAYARRIEDQYAVGVLDMLIAFDDLPVMLVEGKLTDGDWIKPTERQWLEGQRIWQLKGNHVWPVLVGWNTKGRMFVSDWASIAGVRASFRQPDGWNYGRTLQEYANDKYRRLNRHKTNDPR